VWQWITMPVALQGRCSVLQRHACPSMVQIARAVSISLPASWSFGCWLHPSIALLMSTEMLQIYNAPVPATQAMLL
jgi:hypothetical protein